ncbi:unnamed protein product [Pylaiella littoralis]
MKIDQIFSRLALGVKGLNVFTRSEQVAIIKASYKAVPMNVSTLRNEGNFKDFLMGRYKMIPSITRWWAFLLLRSEGNVGVCVKEFMRSRDWSGPTRDGKSRAGTPPHSMFIGPPPNLRGDIPMYELKPVMKETIRFIGMRYEASRERLQSAYPGDSSRWQEITEEQDGDIALLGVSGKLPFDLPRDLLPLGDDNLSESGGGGENNIPEKSQVYKLTICLMSSLPTKALHPDHTRDTGLENHPSSRIDFFLESSTLSWAESNPKAISVSLLPYSLQRKEANIDTRILLLFGPCEALVVGLVDARGETSMENTFIAVPC